MTSAISPSTLTKDVEEIHNRYDKPYAGFSPLLLPVANFVSALVVILKDLVGVEAVVSIGLSAGLTVYVYNVTESNLDFDGGIMSWTLLTFAVVTPLSSSVGMAFRRRELALTYMKTMQSSLVQIYIAHSTWDWPKRGQPDSGRRACRPIAVAGADDSPKESVGDDKVDWMKFSDGVLGEILCLIDELRMLLLLPTSSRARHRVLNHSISEAKSINDVSRRIHKVLVSRIGTLSARCEYLKLQGMPGNEASRIRQWEQYVADSIEGLRLIKSYRTPQALRSYSRLLSVIVPPLFCPYYADLARSTGSLGLAIFYAVLTALALTGLFDCVVQLEDPFFGHTSLDGVNVHSELGQSLRDRLLLLRGQSFPNARPFELSSGIEEEESLPDG